MNRWNKTCCDRCGEKVEKGEGIYSIVGFFHTKTCYEEVKQEYINNYEWEDYKTFREDEMICPYCGYESRDSFECDNEGIRQCGRCESEFEYERAVEVTYTTTQRK